MTTPNRPKSPTRRRALGALLSGTAVASLPISGCTTSASSERGKAIEQLEGRVIRRGEPAYERWRQSLIWQMRKPDRFPELIVRPTSSADVAAAVRFAAARGLRVAVKSGGHNVWCSFLRDEGLLLDLAEFKHFRPGARGGTTEVGPALWARDLTAALARANQGFPVAHCATVPLGGYVTGGGLGINGDAWGGMACFAVRGATVVTAEGEILKVDETHNTELLWALRGGADRFPGVACSFDIQTFDRPRGLYSSTFAFPLTAVEDALDMLESMARSEPAKTELLGLMLHAPGAPLAVGDAASKVFIVRAQVYVDDERIARRTLAPMMEHPAQKHSGFKVPFQPESFESLFVDSMDWRRGFGFGRFAVDNAWVDDLRAGVRAVAEAYAAAPSWKSHVVVQPKLRPLPEADAGAFSIMDSTYLAAYAVWDDRADDDANQAWIRQMGSALETQATGRFINETDVASNPHRIRQCYSEPAWNRLTDLRRQRDPLGTFFDFPGL